MRLKALRSFCVSVMEEYYYEEPEGLGPRLFSATLGGWTFAQAIFSFSESRLLFHFQNEKFGEAISRIAFSFNLL